MAAIRLAGVSKRFGDEKRGFVNALRDATAQVADGELVVFVGPSGCGKTTLLRAVAGLEFIDAGSIFIGDRLVNDLEPKERNVAMVFQDYALYPHMSAYENLTFGLLARGVAKREADATARRVAETMDLSGVLERKPRELSGGERQRVALGRAMVRSPRAFLLDEPLSNLDAQLRVQMRLELAELHRRLGATMLYVTHDQVEAMTLGDRIAVMREGELLQIDTPQNIYRKPANMFVARFIGAPAMNLIGDKARGRVLGLRPEDVRLIPPGDGEALLRAVTGLCEHLGSEVLVHAKVGEIPIVARLGPTSAIPAPGTQVGLAFDPAAALWFDPATGERVG